MGNCLASSKSEKNGETPRKGKPADIDGDAPKQAIDYSKKNAEDDDDV